MSTKFGGPKFTKFYKLQSPPNMWQSLVTAKNRTVISTHSKSSFSDAHISVAKGLGPLKISQMVQDDQRLLNANAYRIGGGSAPTIPKIRKFAKILCTLRYIVGVCWGNCTNHFHMMCPCRGIKISASNFGGPSPLKFWNPKTYFSTARSVSYTHLTLPTKRIV